MKMHHTFNIENMETYFKHYIPCREHPKQPITNFCTQRICLRFLCPECVEVHSLQHANHPIQSIRTCVKKTSERISFTVKELQNQTNNHNFLKLKSADQYTNTLLKELQQVKNSLIAEISAYFKQKEMEIRKETQKSHAMGKHMDSLRDQIFQAIKQLKMLNNHLFDTSETVKAIKKANSIDYQNMILHFKRQIHGMESQLNFHMKLEMDPHKRQHFRNSLNCLVGIKNTGKNHLGRSREWKGHNITNNIVPNGSNSRYHNQPIPVSEEEIMNDQQYVINPPPLSADRLMNQASLRIEMPNYFSGEPFLHFFEVTKSCLHITRINQVIQTQKNNWEVIPLNIDFKVPSFHRTLASEEGNIYLIGGTFAENMKKSNKIFQYDPMNRTLNHIASLQSGRSSHSIALHKKLVYIAGGMTDNDEVLRKFQVFNPLSREVKVLNPSKIGTTNSILCYIGDNIIKMGGVTSSGENNDHIEIYNITANFWGEADPTIQNVRGQFGLISCSGWSILNNNQVFIFGGYNQETQNENSKMSFVLESTPDNDYTIKYVSAKNLPIAQGFWNQQAVVHKGSIYCLQNVDGYQQNDCLQDYRNLLVFNGKYWSTCHSD